MKVAPRAGHGKAVQVDLLQELLHHFEQFTLLVIEEGLEGGRDHVRNTIFGIGGNYVHELGLQVFRQRLPIFGRRVRGNRPQ